MNQSQIHLALTHIPVVLSLTGLAIIIFSFFSKNPAVSRIALYILVTAGMFTLPVFFTGEGAEEVVENIAGVSRSLVEKHEDMAKLSLWIILVTAIVALAALFRIRAKSSLAFLKLPILVLAFVSAAGMAVTAHYGGQIRHTEINSGTVASAADNGEGDLKDEDD
jgi:uncharacterized membrane protein